MPAQSTCLTATLASCLFFTVGVGAARLPFRTPLFADENSISPNAKYGGPSNYEIKDWVRIKHSGPRMNRVSPGGRVELECEANGSPPPNVQWFHNSRPVTQEIEDNSIGGLHLGTVKSRLVLDCVTPRHHGTYTCVATSGAESAVSQRSMLFVQGNNASALLPACAQTVTAPPHIVTWNTNRMETIGNDVVLPCVSMGNPRPQMYWIDGENQLITNGEESQSEDRYKVLDSGDLMISAVSWTDMGYFSCVAESPLGRDTTTTFLYPMAKDR